MQNSQNPCETKLIIPYRIEILSPRFKLSHWICEILFLTRKSLIVRQSLWDAYYIRYWRREILTFCTCNTCCGRTTFSSRYNRQTLPFFLTKLIFKIALILKTRTISHLHHLIFRHILSHVYSTHPTPHLRSKSNSSRHMHFFLLSLIG